MFSSWWARLDWKLLGRCCRYLVPAACILTDCAQAALLKSVSCSVVSDSLQLSAMDSSSPGFSVHGILQARILEWVVIPFSRGSSWPRDQTQVSCSEDRFFTSWATRKALLKRPPKKKPRACKRPPSSPPIPPSFWPWCCLNPPPWCQ